MQSLLSQERVKLQTSNCLDTPYYLRKATNFKILCAHSVDRWKQKPIYKFLLAYSGTLENFQGTHVQGASRDHLCDGSAFLFILSRLLGLSPANLSSTDLLQLAATEYILELVIY